jgi:TRAP-type C4-dicarboxylate transport system permease small subunit
VRSFEAAYARVIGSCAAISGFVVFATTAVITLNVVLRAATGFWIPGDVQLAEYAMLLLTAFAAPWLLHSGQHVRVDLLLQSLPPRVGWACELAADVLGLAVSLLMAWYGSQVLLASLAEGRRVVNQLSFPEWWMLWPLPMMFALLAVEFVLRFRRALYGPRRARREGATAV